MSHREIRKHRATIVQVGETKEEIDVMLAPLIEEIWKAGIETLMSCQETEPGMAWIEFPSVEELVQFLNIVADHEAGIDTLYNRISNQLNGPLSARSWEYQLNLDDGGLSLDRAISFTGPPDFYATVGVYFPHGDLPILLDRMKANNEWCNSPQGPSA